MMNCEIIQRIRRIAAASLGQVGRSEESRTCSCTCGATFATPTELDDHFHEVFTPDDDIAPDGRLHAEVTRPEPAPDPSADRP